LVEWGEWLCGAPFGAGVKEMLPSEFLVVVGHSMARPGTRARRGHLIRESAKRKATGWV